MEQEKPTESDAFALCIVDWMHNLGTNTMESHVLEKLTVLVVYLTMLFLAFAFITTGITQLLFLISSSFLGISLFVIALVNLYRLYKGYD